MKTCSRCRQAKPLDDFKTDTRKPDGKASACKACTAVPKVGETVTELVPYNQARLMLAEAKAVDDVKRILDKAVAMKEYARRAADRSLEIDAAEIRFHAERRLGQMIGAQKETVGLHKGGRPPEKTPAEAEEVSLPRLEDVGISHKLSAHAQKMAAVAPAEFEARIGAWRAEVSEGQSRVTMDLLRIGEAAINGARSVMGSRQEPGDSLDFFPTPPWATRALIEIVFGHLGCRTARLSAWEPACGEGHIAEVLKEYFQGGVAASDIHDYGYGDEIDFLDAETWSHDDLPARASWIITNPPFGDKAEDFVLKALQLARVGVAMFVQLRWLETVGRYENVFRDNPPTLISFFAERVNLCRGRWDPDGSTATAYVWLVWVKGVTPQAPFWIPPGCREALTQPDDPERFTAHPVIKRSAGNNQAQAAPSTEAAE